MTKTWSQRILIWSQLWLHCPGNNNPEYWTWNTKSQGLDMPISLLLFWPVELAGFHTVCQLNTFFLARHWYPLQLVHYYVLDRQMFTFLRDFWHNQNELNWKSVCSVPLLLSTSMPNVTVSTFTGLGTIWCRYGSTHKTAWLLGLLNQAPAMTKKYILHHLRSERCIFQVSARLYWNGVN